MPRLNRVKIAKYFYLDEFESPDSHEVKLHPKLLRCLDATREDEGCAMIVTSGYRTWRHNREVGGVKNSRHRLGTAADVIFKEPGHTPTTIRTFRANGAAKVIYYPKTGHFHVTV